ncbi:hypothetical protein H311_02870, partial [Anncaliia algerae PRA109]
MVEKTTTTENAVAWLQELEIIPNGVECHSCNNYQMTLTFYKNTHRWKCNKCYSAVSIFDNTIFFNTKLSLPRLLDIVYFWSCDMTQTKTRSELDTKSSLTVFRWYQKLQRLSYTIIRNASTGKIGGPGHLIEIDESKFSKRKYQVGRIVQSPWVVGAIDIHTHECFFVEVL